IEGPITREVTANEQGAYQTLVTTGDYSLTAAAFGYDPESAAATVEPDSVSTVDFALAPSPYATLRGTVTDGSGQGWPLHARLTVVDTDIETFTDPVTGEYAVELPAGQDYTVLVEAEYPGYRAHTLEVENLGHELRFARADEPTVHDV